jgi:hypothetical protein
VPLRAVALLAVVSGFVLCSVPAHADTKNLSISSIDIAAPTKATGAVKARVSVVASPGTKVTYSVGKPAKGTVSVNAATGAFTYTPTAAARHSAAKEGASAAVRRDVVPVIVTDSEGHRATKSVRVPILGANSAPVASSVVIGTPDPKTGVVTGRVTFTDADGDALTYSVASNTSPVSRSGLRQLRAEDPAGRTLSSTSSNGSLTMINPATGAFTYTPTQATPPSSGVSSTDTFTVSASDGYGGTASVPVSVPVTAPNPATGVVVGSTGSVGGNGGAGTTGGVGGNGGAG